MALAAESTEDLGIGARGGFEVRVEREPCEEIELFGDVEGIAAEDLEEDRLRERDGARVGEVVSARVR